ncbi:DHH family phosphoesterase, partial [Planctomycetota bacterium]
LRHSASPGIMALVRQAGAAGKPLSPRDVSFRIGPRLNAAGRLGAADICVELLMCSDLGRAVEIARQLDGTNRERQRIQGAILEEALERIAQLDGFEQRRTIVLADEQWHAGVVGIVASRLAEDFHRPALLLSIDGDTARGSARSVPGLNLFEAIEACEDLLLAYGGHAGAAGVRLKLERLDEFREQFEQEVQRRMGDGEPCGVLEIEAEIDLGAVGHRLVSDLDGLAPYGQGNRPPVLVCSGVAVAGQPRLMGQQGQHISFYVRGGESSLRVVGFGMGGIYDDLASGGVACDIAFTPRLNSFRGTDEVELELCDLRLR